MQYEIEKIIEVAKVLQRTGCSGARTGERIAAAFVLNNMHYLPASYPYFIDAWERLGPQWQGHVKTIKQNYMHLSEGGG